MRKTLSYIRRITPQAIFSPALPEGWVVKSSGPLWMMTVLPTTSCKWKRSVTTARYALPWQQRRQVSRMTGMGQLHRIIVRPRFRKTAAPTGCALMDMQSEEIGGRFRQTLHIHHHENTPAMGIELQCAFEVGVTFPAPDTGTGQWYRWILVHTLPSASSLCANGKMC